LTAVHAPGARRAPARDADPPAEETAAVPSGQARARQWLRAKSGAACARAKEKLLAAAISAIDSGIVALQGLRLHAGGEQPEDERRERERARPRKPTVAGQARTEAGAEDLGAIKKPKRRLRGLLIYLVVTLLGGMGGMALSYDLLAQLLDRQAVELKRQEIKQSKYSKSVARLQAQVDSAQAKQAKAETRLEEVLAESQNKLVEGEKKLGELEKKRADAETRLASAHALRASAAPRPREGGGGRSGARNDQTAWAKRGDCTLGGGDVQSVLKGCMADMGRYGLLTFST